MRLRVVNTDAEGRMAMVDVLAHMKEKALNEVKFVFLRGPLNLTKSPFYF